MREIVKMKKYAIVSPEVTRIASEHFGFDLSQDGLHLADGEMEHWDGILLNQELIGIHLQSKSLISKFTFALLKDSGWYDVDIEKTA